MKKLIALALVLAAGVGGGYAVAPKHVPGSLTVKGHLHAEQFRPLLAGACDTWESKEQARVAWSEERNPGTRLAKIVLPRVAEAAGFCAKLADVYRPNLIVNAGETALRDCFNNNAGSACTGSVATFKFHGIGTGVTAAAEGDTGLGTELTTQYNPDNTRATGSQTTNGANVYRSVGTNTIDSGTPAVTEWGLFTASSAGTMWSRVVFSAINLVANDSLQTTYDLTIE